MNIKEKIDRKNIARFILAIIFIWIAFTFYISPNTAAANFSRPILNDNWGDSFEWIKENTKECAVIATYWDPGHFIQSISNRSVIFGGSTQNELLIKNAPNEPDRLEIEEYDNGVVKVINYTNGTAQTARIKDITSVFMTGNESFAVETLRDYVKPGCDEIYVLATSDLVQKSTWWTYFSTWSPNKEGDCPVEENSKGSCYNYLVLGLTRSDGNNFYYSPDPRFAYVVKYNETDNSYDAFLQANRERSEIRELRYINGSNFVVKNNPDAELDGILYIASQDLIVHIPEELKDSLFTRLYFFNGDGLNNFELINNWGGEVKLFKVRI